MGRCVYVHSGGRDNVDMDVLDESTVECEIGGEGVVRH
jgi:hypothetical protein